ncbi:MAG: Ig-like domain repeat protein [Blastocatellia bacterium]
MPTGSVTFRNGGQDIGTGTIDNTGKAILTTSALPAGALAITAVYAGDTNFSGVTSAPLTQTILPICQYTLSASGKVINELASANNPVNVTAQSHCAWTAVSNDSWITINSGGTGQGNGVVTWSATANPTDSVRTGTMTIAGQTYEVKQGSVSFAVSAANFDGARISPGQILAIFGLRLSDVTEAATATPLPTTLGNVSVTIKDSAGVSRPAAMLYVSPGQVNVVMPEASADGRAVISFMTNGRERSAGEITVFQVAPGLFTADGTGNGAPLGILLRAGLSGAQQFQALFTVDPVTNQVRPAILPLSAALATGEDLYLILYGTGVRGATSAANVRAQLDGVDLEIAYVVAQSEYAGLDQINIRISPTLRLTGEADLVITVDGVTAKPVRLQVE